jgi:hypothetical protein
MVMAELKERLADYIQRLRAEAQQIRQTPHDDWRPDGQIRGVKAELCHRIAGELLALLNQNE